MKKIKYSESDLADRIINHLEKIGWMCYKEVSMKGSGGDARSDCYFVKKDGDLIIDSIALETKLSFNLKVIEQADKWIAYSNMSYVCVPAPKRVNRKNLSFGLKICKSLNIGVYEVDMDKNIIKELYMPKRNDRCKYPPIYEQQRDSVAGNNKSEYITSFKITVLNLEEYMKDKNGVELKSVVENIKHHYKNNTSAYNTIKKFIDKKIIKGYFLSKDDKKIIILKD